MKSASNSLDGKMVREYTSEFTAGECWGYNKFVLLDELESGGYIDDEHDTLNLEFHVRATSFYRHCQDQARFIELLENKNLADSVTGVPQHPTDTGHAVAAHEPDTPSAVPDANQLEQPSAPPTISATGDGQDADQQQHTVERASKQWSERSVAFIRESASEFRLLQRAVQEPLPEPISAPQSDAPAPRSFEGDVEAREFLVVELPTRSSESPTNAPTNGTGATSGDACTTQQPAQTTGLHEQYEVQMGEAQEARAKPSVGPNGGLAQVHAANKSDQ
jgi:hypothetical protein